MHHKSTFLIIALSSVAFSNASKTPIESAQQHLIKIGKLMIR